MIIKITRKFDNWHNLSSENFREVEEMEFKRRDTERSVGNLEEEMHIVSNMKELADLIKPNFFNSYTEYATFLIANEAKFNAKEQTQ